MLGGKKGILVLRNVLLFHFVEIFANIVKSVKITKKENYD